MGISGNGDPLDSVNCNSDPSLIPTSLCRVLAELIELVARIWQADSEIRESSVVGESEMDRRSRRFVSWLSLIHI